MNGFDPLGGIVLPPKPRNCVEQHLAGIERAENDRAVRMWVDRAQSLIEGLEASGAFNDTTIEALYIHVDNVALARLEALKA
ncbi:hypothetical protein [Pseudomonas yamanorum]|uniref:hypothetical protein n=1 Tax=Pseudomonas yamanorum TaxID=515393 RepID=UPI00087CF34B|nr:hypothetical protein [Pseudomonas yamanorum]SDT94035.1 hypothetical protein SAMN05216237_0568 [Pseudomonas yamanorum]